MKIIKVLIACSFYLIAATKVADAQYIAHYIERDHVQKDTLIDRSTGVKFILDKQRVYVTAIDKNKKVLWKVDPVIDNKLGSYRVKRPKIVYYEFSNDNKGQQVIQISYNNSQGGYLDKKSGEFFFVGQD